MVPPEYARIAWGRDERERPVGMIGKGGIEFTEDVVQHARRGDENGAAIAAGGWMADAIGRSLCKEHSLIGVGCDAAPAEVLAECAAAHENDVAAARVFFG